MNYNEIQDVECGCGRKLTAQEWINEMREMNKITFTGCPMLSCGCVMCVGCGKFKPVFVRKSNDEYWDLPWCKECGTCDQNGCNEPFDAFYPAHHPDACDERYCVNHDIVRT